jgi:PAP2 superfamily.
MRQHWLLKTVGISAFITVFFIAYFRLLKAPIFPVTVMPVTWLDHVIAFNPYALVIYLSLWIYVPIAPIAIADKRKLYALGWEAGGVAIVGLGIFLFFPTMIPALPIDWARYPGFEFLKTVDAAGNACPSLHVAFAVFTALRFDETLRELRARAVLHVGNWAWALGIVYSTLAIKQHVAVDAYAGTLLGVVGGQLHWTRWFSGRATAAR